MRFFGYFERGLSATDARRVEYALRLSALLVLSILLGAYLYLADILGTLESVQMVGGLAFSAAACCAFAVGIRLNDTRKKLRQVNESSIKGHYVKSGNAVDGEASTELDRGKLRKSLICSSVGSVMLLATLVVTGLAAITGLEFLCISLPDLGACRCDSRPLLTTTDAPDFSTLPGQDSVLIAQFGDTTLEHLEKNLQLVKDAGADLLIINGDLTYYAEIAGLEKAIISSLGDDFPVLNTVGNHDTGIYTEYQAVFQRQYNRYRNTHSGVGDLLCEGEIGVSQVCSFRGLGIVLSGIGSTCSTDERLNAKLVEQLQLFENQNVTWKSVFIHKNQHILQTGSKKDEVGWAAYEAALASGAAMYNGHEHAYARTKQISAFDIANQVITTTENTGPEFSSANLTNGTHANLDVLVVKSGATHVVLNGIGGKNVRSATDDAQNDPWWSSLYNSNVGAVFATHFCEYRAFGRDDLAYCYLENIRSEIVDQYVVLSE